MLETRTNLNLQVVSFSLGDTTKLTNFKLWKRLPTWIYKLQILLTWVHRNVAALGQDILLTLPVEYDGNDGGLFLQDQSKNHLFLTWKSTEVAQSLSDVGSFVAGYPENTCSDWSYSIHYVLNLFFFFLHEINCKPSFDMQ